MKQFIKRIYVTTAVLLIAASSEAALPPFYESLSEYKSLLNNQELANKWGSADTIHDIQRTEKGFIVSGRKHALEVDLVYDPQDQPGPAKFHFVFHELQSTND